MTNEERRKAAEWFRNRAKNCPMPATRRMYEIATEALETQYRQTIIAGSYLLGCGRRSKKNDNNTGYI